MRDDIAGVDSERVKQLRRHFRILRHAPRFRRFVRRAVPGKIQRNQFQIAGEGIDTICLCVDRGMLWRAGESLGAQLTEPFNPAAVYGLAPLEGEAMEAVDGTTLTLTAHFSDGTEKTQTYTLSAENLRLFENENGEKVLVPALTGDTAQTASALYAVAQGKSTWLAWPVEGSSAVSLSAPYGRREETGYFHSGIDIPGQRGENVAAAAAGTVTQTGYDAARGNYLILDHGSGLTTLYGHCQEVLAAEGESVETGQIIALLGSTGMSTGPHLHFEVRQEGQAQNPVAYFDAALRDTLRMG